MPTLISDAPDWTDSYKPVPGFKHPTIRESLAKGFGEAAEFYVEDGRPVVVSSDSDFAVDYSTYPAHGVHPFRPLLSGTEITETEFRTLVRAMHGIVD